MVKILVYELIDGAKIQHFSKTTKNPPHFFPRRITVSP